MNPIEMLFLALIIYVVPIIFLAPYTPHRIIHFIPIVNFIYMLILFAFEVSIWLSDNDDNDKLSKNT